MNELAEPLTRDARREIRIRQIQQLVARKAQVELQLRTELVALHDDDTEFGWRRFVADELALALAESPRTAARWVEQALICADYPELMAKVADGSWTPRHADAVLAELLGTRLDPAAREQVLELVLGGTARTPYELGKATRAAVLLHDLDAAEKHQQSIHDRRSVSFHDDTDGSVSAVITGTKTQLATLRAALEAAVGVPARDDQRGYTQRCFDYLMDLVCGRTAVTAPWQALIVVSLDTVLGGDTPAEIPGLGLVTAEEARDVVGQAELRRVVVDEQGVMISVDPTTHTPDLVPDETAAPLPTSDQVEPGAVDEPAPDATSADRQWLAGLPAEAAAHARADDRDRHDGQLLAGFCDVHGELGFAEQVEELMTEIGTALDRASRREQALARIGVTVVRHAQPPGDPPAEPPDRPGPHRPGGDSGGSRPPGPTPPTQPTPAGNTADTERPPSAHDRDWLEIREHLARTQDRLDQQAHAQHRQVNPSSVLRQTRPDRLAPSLHARQRQQRRLEQRRQRARWTLQGLTETLQQLRTDPVAPKPDASKGYLFRGRLAHWLKTRDITCTFPGCTLLAQRCQCDHVVEHPHGPTHVDNGAAECVHHHQCKHASIRATRLPDGTMRWQPPSSHYVDRPPRPLLRGW